MRDATSILERIMITCLGEEISLEKTEQVLGVTPLKKMQEFLEKLLDKDYTSLIKILDNFWKESVEIELFFKDLAKYCKNLMGKGELEPEQGLEIIGAIYDSLNKFKYEEDKRLVGYVAINNLLSIGRGPVITQEKIVERIIEKPVLSVKSEDETPEKEEIGKDITFEYILSQWKNIVEEAKKEKITLAAFLISAKPYNLEKNNLIIGFDGENSFAKEQMESPVYNDVLTNVVRKLISPSLKIKYVFLGKRKEKNKNESKLADQIVKFFGGEIIE